MESRRTIQIAGALFCVLLIITEICCYPPTYSHEDYEQAAPGLREIYEELERQGITGPIVPRAYRPDQRMMRKSQRSSSNLRLRFGKRSAENMEPIGNPNWKVGNEVQRED